MDYGGDTIGGEQEYLRLSEHPTLQPVRAKFLCQYFLRDLTITTYFVYRVCSGTPLSKVPSFIDCQYRSV